MYMYSLAVHCVYLLFYVLLSMQHSMCPRCTQLGGDHHTSVNHLLYFTYTLQQCVVQRDSEQMNSTFNLCTLILSYYY